MRTRVSDGIRTARGSATKYYVDADGNYLGGWADAPCPVAGAVEVPGPPASADQRRVGNGWEAAEATSAPAPGQSGSNTTDEQKSGPA